MIHTDSCASRGPLADVRITPDPTIVNDGRQPIDMNNMINLWLSWDPVSQTACSFIFVMSLDYLRGAPSLPLRIRHWHFPTSRKPWLILACANRDCQVGFSNTNTRGWQRVAGGANCKTRINRCCLQELKGRADGNSNRPSMWASLAISSLPHTGAGKSLLSPSTSQRSSSSFAQPPVAYAQVGTVQAGS